MKSFTLQARLLGTISITIDDLCIRCDSGRSRQTWRILAYLLHNRTRTVSSEELIALLQLEEKGVNPAGALKTAMHRVRTLLNRFGDNMGHTLLRFRDNGYCFSSDVAIQVDTERFEAALSPELPADPDRILKALELYNGNFCSALADDSWVIPLSVYYQNLYARGVQTVAVLLETSNRYTDCAALCRRAILQDPYREIFSQLLMRSLLALGQREQVIAVYENLSKIMLNAVGVMPDQESRALYREALRTNNLPKILPETLSEQLRETAPVRGALLCDFDFFRNVYQAQARLLLRSGESVHIVLMDVSLADPDDRRPLEHIMDELEAHLCSSLRKGDVVTRYSAAQFVLMLPHADYENSTKVCLRLTESFAQKVPNVTIDCFVQAISPADA